MYLTTKELALQYGCSVETVRRRLAAMKELPEYRSSIMQPGAGKMWADSDAFEHYSCNASRIKKGVYYERFKKKNRHKT